MVFPLYNLNNPVLLLQFLVGGSSGWPLRLIFWWQHLPLAAAYQWASEHLCKLFACKPVYDTTSLFISGVLCTSNSVSEISTYVGIQFHLILCLFWNRCKDFCLLGTQNQYIYGLEDLLLHFKGVWVSIIVCRILMGRSCC